jgi:hypothetical protein
MSRADHIKSIFAKAAELGRRIRGGCDVCQAHQTLDADDSGEWHLIVHITTRRAQPWPQNALQGGLNELGPA